MYCKTRRRYLAALVSLNLGVAGTSCLADSLGLSQFRTDTNNAYLGQGIIVAQPESSYPTFEITPANAGITVPVTYIYYNSTTSQIVTMTSLEANYTSSHADAVASFLAGTSGGVAPDLSQILNYDADLYANYYVLENVPLPYPVKVINQSFIETPDKTFTEPILDQFFDNFAVTHHYLIVTAAGNSGNVQPPGSAYNVLTVGAYGGTSSVSQPGQLCKPDITAPADATSYSTPCVSGIAALMVQVAGSGDGVDPRVQKALLLNGATQPAGWTHTPTQPLDRTYGAGIANADNTYHNLIAGEHHATSLTSTASVGGAHAPTATGNVGGAGWDLGSLTSSSSTDAVANYVIDLSQDTSIFNFTATLTWFRANDQTLTNEYIANANNPNFTNFTSSIYTINNLDLYLYNVTTGQQVDLSNSSIDSVEHLVTIGLPPGKYDLQVVKNGGAVGTPNVFSNGEVYGLAWSAGNQSTITNNSNLTFSQTNAITVTTTITGTGTVTQAGTGTTTLTGAASYTGPTIISAGKLSFSGGTTHSVGSISGTGTLVVDTATTLTSDGVNLLNGTWIINGTHVIRSSANGGAYTMYAGGSSSTALSGTSIASNVTFGAGAKLDLRNNALIIEAAAGTKAAMLAQIAGDVTSGAITSSTAATNQAYGIEVVDNAALGATTFGGLTVDANSIIVTQALLGDANLDGHVDLNDFNLWLNHSGNQGVFSAAGGDFNGDGFVDLSDFNVWLAHSGNSIGSGGAPSIASGALGSLSGGTVAAPEPSALALLGVGGAATLMRRRRGRR